MADRERFKKEIIMTGRRLARSGLVVARAGNLSCRLDARRMLITASGSALGALVPRDVVTVDIETGVVLRPRPHRAGRDGHVANPRTNRTVRDGLVAKPSSELPLHRLIHQTFADAVIVHCHPALINAYFCIYPDLKYLTFESRYYLGDVPVVGQRTLTVTDPGPVIAAMSHSGIVVLRNHGVFSRAPSFSAALEKIEILEEAVRVYAIARLFNRKKLDALDRELKKYLVAAA